MKKIIVLLLFVCMLFSMAGCEYTKDDNVDNTQSVKIYTDEEKKEILSNNKYPKAFVKDASETFEHPNYMVSVKNIRVLDSINGLDEKDFLDFDMINNWVDADGKFKVYNRVSYKPINGYLDIEIVGEDKNIQPEFLLVDLVLTNTSDSKVTTTITPGYDVYLFEDIDEEFIGEPDGHIQYKNADGKKYPSEGPSYFTKSQYRDSDNEVTRGKKFFTYEFEPNEVLECTVGFIIDKDMEEYIYLSFLGEQFDTLVKVF